MISVPYRINSPNSPFLMGAALTFYRKNFGLYIEDENIADDGYIGNCFLKYLYDNRLLNEPSNIVKDGFACFHFLIQRYSQSIIKCITRKRLLFYYCLNFI